MPNFNFPREQEELLANRVFKVRLGLLLLVVLLAIAPIVMIHVGVKMVDEVTGSDEWFSVENQVGVTEFLTNPSICSALKRASCPAGTTESDDGSQCFWYDKEMRTKADAILECAKKDGTLASIRNAADNRLVAGWCKDDAPCWVGLFRMENVEGWIWADGTQFEYKKWHKDHPLKMADSADQGAVGVFGYKRMAKFDYVVVGSVLLANLLIQVVGTSIVLVFFFRAMRSKSLKLLKCVTCCDGCSLISFAAAFLAAVWSFATKVTVENTLGLLTSLSLSIVLGFLVSAGLALYRNIAQAKKESQHTLSLTEDPKLFGGGFSEPEEAPGIKMPKLKE